MKTNALLLAILIVGTVFATPTATITSTTLADDVLTVEYTLDAPAVITFDILTNGTSGASIGGEAVVSGILHGSEVWMKVTGEGPHTIKWRADAWDGNADIIAAVTAWPLDNPPNYMVADISNAAQPNTQRYYPEADFVPGGVLGNVRYRQTALLMRKVMAKGITWTMGDSTVNRPVTLTNNYYIGVFEVTQAQWAQVKGNYPSEYNNLAAREMRPVEKVSYNQIRVSTDGKWYSAWEFPNPPHTSSFLGIVRTRTGIDFDLPGEAQWEYACRAGHGNGYWGDGSTYSAATMPGRCKENGGDTTYNSNTNKGTAACGSYKPNSWGIYDMHGNVYELCLDWYVTSSLTELDYRVNIDPDNRANPLVGSTTTSKVKRGGCADKTYANSHPAARNSDASTTVYYNFGFRVMCPVEVP